MGRPFPVIMCDVCRTVTPALFGPCAHSPEGTTEAERMVQLRGEGWVLGDRDVCPACVGRGHG